MKRCRSSSNLVELSNGSAPAPIKRLHRTLLSSSASSEQLFERVSAAAATTTTTAPTPSMGTTSFPTRPILIPFRGLPSLPRRPLVLGSTSSSFSSAGGRATTAAFGGLTRNHHIITLKLGDDEENQAPYSSLACVPVPSWAPPPAHDGPCHARNEEEEEEDDEEERYPSCSSFHRKYRCSTSPTAGSPSSTATTATTSTSGSYVADSELDDDSSGCGDGNASPASSLASTTDADIMHELVKEMERLFDEQQEAAAAAAVAALALTTALPTQCWEDGQHMAPRCTSHQCIGVAI